MGEVYGAWGTPGPLTVMNISVTIEYCDVVMAPALLQHSFLVLSSGNTL